MDLREHLSSLSADPQKILKIVVGISAVLLLMWLFMISRMEYTTDRQRTKAVVSERVDSLQTLLKQKKTDPALAKKESSGMFMNAVTTFLVLLAVLGLVWFWTSRKNGSDAKRKGREIDSQPLGEGAQMKIVEVNGEVWVLGVTSSSVNLLHRYPESEWTEQIEESTDQLNFSKIFKSKT